MSRSQDRTAKRVLIAGGGFVGLNAAKKLAGEAGIEVLLLDRRNHHLFQPLLYQVATAGLSPAEIAVPIRSLLSGRRNVRVLQAKVESVDLTARRVHTSAGDFPYDYLILACGAMHTYFGKDDWEGFAPGLKTIEQATEIRRRVLQAFEEAESSEDPSQRRKLLTFVIVGGGPTGVELAGAIGEMTRFALTRDFRRIDPKSARIMLIEAGERILPSFKPRLSARAARELEKLGVQVWTSSMVTRVDSNGVEVGSDRIAAATVLWAAGIEASGLGRSLGLETDGQGRVVVQEDLSLKDHPEVFVAGDMAHREQGGRILPATAPVAMQQGRYLGRLIRDECQGRPRRAFRFRDKGQMATIGRSRAIAEVRGFGMGGFLAWMAWLVIHIYYLTGFKNRLLVVAQWAWSYFTFSRGARLIVGKEWRRNTSDV